MIALAVLWTSGLLLFVYYIFIFDQSKRVDDDFKPDPATGFFGNKSNETTNTEISDNNFEGSDVYVFVNVNKKRFLTRFVSSIPAEKQDSAITISNPQAGNISVERINKIKTKPVKKDADFFIRPIQ